MELIDPVLLLVATYICKVTLLDPSLTVEAGLHLLCLKLTTSATLRVNSRALKSRHRKQC